jgi:Tol biopolymer transport system component
MGDDITRIMAMSADGTYEEDLRIAGQQPSWAPDNDRFVYRGCDITGNRCGLWLARAIPLQAWDLGKNMIGPLLQEPEAAHPDWSPVGDQIVYQSPKSGSWDLYLINADGSNQRQLTNDPALEGLPAWSPDGQWLAYLSNAGGNWGIWLIRADGSQRQLLFAFDGGTFNPKPITPYFSRDWLDEQISWSR